jgi:hypothetical protein
MVHKSLKMLNLLFYILIFLPEQRQHQSTFTFVNRPLPVSWFPMNAGDIDKC